MSLNVSLPPELENRVRQHVESGLYSSASEVIREALRLFEAYQGVQAANLVSLKADITQGVADIGLSQRAVYQVTGSFQRTKPLTRY